MNGNDKRFKYPFKKKFRLLQMKFQACQVFYKICCTINKKSDMQLVHT